MKLARNWKKRDPLREDMLLFQVGSPVGLKTTSPAGARVRFPLAVVTDAAPLCVKSGDVTDVEKAPVVPLNAPPVMPSAPTSIAPKPDVMEPVPSAPTVVIPVVPGSGTSSVHVDAPVFR